MTSTSPSGWGTTCGASVCDDATERISTGMIMQNTSIPCRRMLQAIGLKRTGNPQHGSSTSSIPPCTEKRKACCPTGQKSQQHRAHPFRTCTATKIAETHNKNLRANPSNLRPFSAARSFAWVSMAATLLRQDSEASYHLRDSSRHC